MLLRPSKKLQEILLEKDPRLEFFGNIPRKFDEERLHIETRKVLDVAELFYSNHLPRQIGFYNLIKELLKNTRVHSSSTIDYIDFAIFLSRSAMCVAIHDDGDFYRRADIKKILENKFTFPQKEFANNLTQFSGFGVGMELIYAATDIIELDNSNGTIYCLKRIE